MTSDPYFYNLDARYYKVLPTTRNLVRWRIDAKKGDAKVVFLDMLCIMLGLICDTLLWMTVCVGVAILAIVGAIVLLLLVAIALPCLVFTLFLIIWFSILLILFWPCWCPCCCVGCIIGIADDD